jgi:GMC oxidoreductase
MKIGSPAQPTDFSLDVLGRYVCNTFDEAKVASEPSLGGRPFDFIIVGGGTFGSALAEHLWFRSIGRSERVLVLDAGPFLVTEHVQNLPAIGLDSGDAVNHHQPQKEVWGLAWNGNVKFPGLAYCIGGRSLYWGGWSPRLLDAETPASIWPQAVLDDLNADTLPSGEPGYFRQASDQIGVTQTNDYVFGDLHNAMRAQLRLGIGTVGSAISLTALPDHPSVRFSPSPPTADELLKLLGLPPSLSPPTIQDLRDELKLEAPLAVQGQPGHAGYFPFNKFSAVPLLMRAARDAFREAPWNDAKKRLMVVPRCHVSRLNTVPDAGDLRVTEIVTEYGPIAVAPDSNVVIALGTIENTRLALESFGSDGRIGTNLMAHLRSNIDIRVPRAALAGLPAALKALQVSALFVKGRHKFKDSGGNEDGTIGHFHLQITASGLGSEGTDSEAELFKKVPDIDLFEQHLHATDTHVVITIRAVGEMQRMSSNSNVTLDRDPNQTDYGARRAYVNLNAGPKDSQLWDAMDLASDQVAKIFAGGLPFEILIKGQGVPANAGTDLSQVLFYVPKDNPNPNKPGRRDGLGTTHHEAGTLWMGTDVSTSVVNPDCRFHNVSNTYVAGPTVFPSIGSPNPMLTGIALARRLGDHLIPAPPPATPEIGFRYLFDGSEPPADLFSRWKMVGRGGFDKVGRTLVARPGNGIGLLL